VEADSQARRKRKWRRISFRRRVISGNGRKHFNTGSTKVGGRERPFASRSVRYAYREEHAGLALSLAGVTREEEGRGRRPRSMRARLRLERGGRELLRVDGENPPPTRQPPPQKKKERRKTKTDPHGL